MTQTSRTMTEDSLLLAFKKTPAQKAVSTRTSQLRHHFPGFDGQYVVFREGCSPRHAETRLLTTPPSNTRVAECYLNLDQGSGLASFCKVAPFCLGQCNVRIAQPISAILLAVVLLSIRSSRMFSLHTSSQ